MLKILVKQAEASWRLNKLTHRYYAIASLKKLNPPTESPAPTAQKMMFSIKDFFIFCAASLQN